MAFASVHITGLICIDDCLVGIPWCESLQVLDSHTVTYHPQIGGQNLLYKFTSSYT